jgi:membrane protease YdiL (CAAX protease family)
LGFVLSYVRLTYRSGFFISVLVHIFVNTASSTIFLFLDSSG